MLTKRADAPDHYRLPKGPQALHIEQFDGKTPNPDPIYKDMTGWNRRAIRIALSPSATAEQFAAAERLCTLAATDWAAAAAAATAT